MSESSNSKLGCKRCSSFFENILARRDSIATVNLLISLNKLHILLQCFNCRFQQVTTRCIIWSISRPTFLHLTFLVVIQIRCLYLGDKREKYLIFNHTLDFNKIYTQQNHCLNSLQQPFFQSVTFAKVPKLALPNGLIATLSGPYEGNTMIALGFMSQICWRIWNNLHGLLIIPYIPMGIQPTPWVSTITHHISKAKTMRTR